MARIEELEKQVQGKGSDVCDSLWSLPETTNLCV